MLINVARPFLLLFLVFFLLRLDSFSLAQEKLLIPPKDIPPANEIEKSIILPPYRPEQIFPFSQKHYYSLFLRGNGQAVVLSRLVLANPSEQFKDSFQFQITEATPENLVIYQQIIPPRCLHYSTEPLFPDEARPEMLERCLEYSEPDYNEPDYYDSRYQVTYYRLEPQMSGNLVKVALRESLAPKKAGALLISYRTFDYTKKGLFGLFDFSFQTFRLAEEIKTVRVAVSADKGLYLKGAQSQVGYQVKKGSMMGLSETILSHPASGKELAQIGQYGQIVKQSENLAPNETFKLAGSYAKSPWRLFLRPLTISLTLVLLIFAFLVGIVKFTKRSKVILEIAVLSFLSSSFLSLFFFLLNFLFNQQFPYPLFASLFSQSPLVLLFLFLLSTLFVLILLLTPTFIVGFRRGLIYGLFTFLAQFFWLFLFFVLFLVFFASSNESLLPPGPLLGG